MIFYAPSSGIILNSISASITALRNWLIRYKNETKTVLENCLKHRHQPLYMLEDKRLTRRPELGSSIRTESNVHAFSDQVPAGRVTLTLRAEIVRATHSSGVADASTNNKKGPRTFWFCSPVIFERSLVKIFLV